MIYKTKEFASLMKKEALMDDDLIQACKELKQGLFDAALGNHLYKKRVRMRHKGKRAGYRTLIGTMLGDDYFFLYAFAKNKQGNISLREQLALKKLALLFLTLNQQEINQLIAAGELIKIGVI